MSDHIADANKMVSDTPRTDDQECDMFVGVSTFTPSDIQQAFDFARQLERELNAANDRIKRLVEAGDKMEEWLIWSFGPQFKRHTTVLAWIKSKESKS